MRIDPSKYLTSIYDNPRYVTQILESLYTEVRKLHQIEEASSSEGLKYFDDAASLATIQNMTGYLLTQSALDVIERIKVTRKFDLSLLAHQDPQPRYYDLYISAVLSVRVKWEQQAVAILLTRRATPETRTVETRAQFLHLVKREVDETSFLNCPDEEFEMHQWVIRVLLFLELTDPQFLVLPPNKKFSQRPLGYVNPTPNKLVIVTSKWNYHVIRAEGFDVSGHYRAQRVGPGRKGVRMTWINPFQKHGYVRAAKSTELRST